MTTKYLLPCECGEAVAVGVAQAGQRVTCQCGAVLDVPTMKGIRLLERVETPPQPRRAFLVRNNAQRILLRAILLFGIVITMLGLAMAGWVYSHSPRLVPMEAFSPWDSWMVWQQLKQGVRRPSFEFDPYLEAVKVHRYWWYASLTVVGLGLLTTASSVFVPRHL